MSLTNQQKNIRKEALRELLDQEKVKSKLLNNDLYKPLEIEERREINSLLSRSVSKQAEIVNLINDVK